MQIKFSYLAKLINEIKSYAGTGRLVCQTETETAYLYYHLGDLSFAQCEDKTGAPALIRLLEWETGIITFEPKFLPSGKPTPPTTEQEEVFLHALRRLQKLGKLEPDTAESAPIQPENLTPTTNPVNEPAESRFAEVENTVLFPEFGFEPRDGEITLIDQPFALLENVGVPLIPENPEVVEDTVLFENLFENSVHPQPQIEVPGIEVTPLRAEVKLTGELIGEEATDILAQSEPNQPEPELNPNLNLFHFSFSTDGESFQFVENSKIFKLPEQIVPASSKVDLQAEPVFQLRYPQSNPDLGWLLNYLAVSQRNGILQADCRNEVLPYYFRIFLVDGQISEAFYDDGNFVHGQQAALDLLLSSIAPSAKVLQFGKVAPEMLRAYFAVITPGQADYVGIAAKELDIQERMLGLVHDKFTGVVKFYNRTRTVYYFMCEGCGLGGYEEPVSGNEHLLQRVKSSLDSFIFEPQVLVDIYHSPLKMSLNLESEKVVNIFS
jgi:hypothetical protein